jgi:hypothetical protein
MKYSGIQLKNRNEISMKSPLRCLSQKCFYYRFDALGLSLGYLIKVVATSQQAPYSDKLFNEAAIQWLIEMDQAGFS